MSKFEKVWRGLIKTLIYIFTPVFLFYCVCFIITSWTHNGMLWNCIEIPEKLLSLANKVTTIGAIPAITSIVVVLIQLGNIAFKSNIQNKKSSLNMALIEQKQNLVLDSNKTIIMGLTSLVNANLTIEDNEREMLLSKFKDAINKIDNSLANTIDFDNLDVETIKRSLLALQDMGKSISTLIQK